MNARVVALSSTLLLSLAMSACAGQAPPFTPQTAERVERRAHEVTFFGGDGLPSFPPVKRADVLVLALESPELPPGFMRGGSNLILADDVPTREAPHQAPP